MSSVNSGITWTEFQEIFTRIEASFALLMRTVAHIGVAISHSVSECQSDESGEFAIFSQNWWPWQRPLLRYRIKRCRSIICTQNAFIL